MCLLYLTQFIDGIKIISNWKSSVIEKSSMLRNENNKAYYDQYD